MPSEDTRIQDPVLEPPKSLGRILAFLTDLAGPSSLTAQGNPIGAVGLDAQGLADNVADRVSFGGLLPITAMRNALAEKYAARSEDVREFTRWLMQFRDKDAEPADTRIMVVEKPIEGPVQFIEGPPRQLTADELQRLLEAARPQAVPTDGPRAEEHGREERRPEPVPKSKAADYKGPTVEESREAVGFLNRGVWGTNLGVGGFATGLLTVAPGAGLTLPPLALMGASSSFGGMAAFHGAPFLAAGAMSAAGGGLSPYARGAMRVLAPRVIDTAPGPLSMGVFPSPLGALGDVLLGSRAVTPTPQLGQVTLMAPAVRVASDRMRTAGSAVAFEWEDLARGAAPLDAETLVSLRTALPEGTELIFPSLPTGQLPQGAVNLTLSPELSRQLMAGGFGLDAPIVAAESSAMALATTGGLPGGATLMGSLVPGVLPMGRGASILDSELVGPLGALGEAGYGQARSGGVLDFLGMPVRLAPTLGTSLEVRDELAFRQSLSDPGQSPILRPDEFGGLRDRFLAGFYSADVEPDRFSWQKAAPSFGLRDTDAGTLLSPDSRIQLPNSGAPLPQYEGSADPISRGIVTGTEAAFGRSDPPPLGFGEDIRLTAGPAARSTFSVPEMDAPLAGSPELAAPTSVPSTMSYGGTAAFGSTSLPTSPVEPQQVFLDSPRVSSGTSAFEGGESLRPGMGAGSLHVSAASPAQPSPMTSSPSSGSRGPSRTAFGPSYSHLPMLLAAAPTLSPMSSSAPAIPGVGAGAGGYSPVQMALSSGMFESPSEPARPGVQPFRASSGAQPAAPTVMPSRNAEMPLRESQGYEPLPEFRGATSFSPSSLSGAEPRSGTVQLPEMPVRTAPASNPAPTIAPYTPRTPSLGLRRPPTVSQPPAQAMPTGMIQMSQGLTPTPAGSGSGDAKSESRHTNEIGNAAHEVNLLAREVWSILKRRIALDAERHGLR